MRKFNESKTGGDYTIQFFKGEISAKELIDIAGNKIGTKQSWEEFLSNKIIYDAMINAYHLNPKDYESKVKEILSLI